MLKIVTTPAFKTILGNIGENAKIGRFLNEADSKKSNVPPPAEEQPKQSKPQDEPKKAVERAPETTEQPPQQDATEKKSEVDAANAKKDAAEKELTQISYIKLNSNAGVGYLLNSILSDAVKKNTIDALAHDFVTKLKIDSVDTFELFKTESAPFRKIRGFNDLITKMGDFIPEVANSGNKEES